MKLSQERMHFLQFADEYVHRRISARVGAFVVSRENQLELAVWKDSLQTTIWLKVMHLNRLLKRMELRLQLSAVVLQE